MTIKSAPYYWVLCDCCEKRAEYYGGKYATFLSPNQATENLDEAEFETVEVAGASQYLCLDCWCWPEDMPGYDEATSVSDDPVRAHDQHPVKAAGL